MMTEESQNRTTAFIPVREPMTGKLLFRYDPARHLIEIKQRGVKAIVDLMQYHSEPSDVEAIITLSDSA